MYFQSLDNAPTVPAFTLAYRFTDNGWDEWTQRLNKFKAGDAAAIQGACRAMHKMLSGFPFGTSVFVTAAIPSGETTLPAQAGVYILGKYLSDSLGFTWCPQLLTKRVHRKLHNLYEATERDAEVAGAYTASAPPIAPGVVLILDDLITRGSTLNSAATAIKVVAPAAKILGLAPGKTERQSYWADRGTPITNAHVPAALAHAWDNT